MELLKIVNGFFWGWVVASILLGLGVFLAFRLYFVQIRYFRKMFGVIKQSLRKNNNGGVSGFGALCAAISGQMGTGSLVGVATALASGGPGAIFWMWVVAFLGMGITFSEAILGILFRESNGDGTYRGGPAYYMSKGLKCKPLAVFFSLFMILGVGICIAMVQANSITMATTNIFDVNPLIIGAILIVLAGAVVFGGIKRISHFATIIVPFLGITYMCLSLFIILISIDKIPDMFVLIFKSAFNFDSAAGGLTGYTIQQAFRYGVARGLFSNDAGMGTVPSMHCTANVKHPVTQGIAAMFGTFFTTIIICSCTAFTILITGALDTGKTGIELTQSAFDLGIGDWGKYVIFIAMILFGFKTLIVDIYFGEVNVRWFSNKIKVVQSYRVLCFALVLISTMIPTVTLWEIVDLSTAFLVFCNVPAIFLLSKYVAFVLRDYEKQKEKGIDEPIWDYDFDITSNTKKEQIEGKVIN